MKNFSFLINNKNIVPYLLIVLMVLVLFYPLGLYYIPIHDGWVGVNEEEIASFSFFRRGGTRFFRSIPYWVHKIFFIEGFWIIKSFLIAIYLGVGIGFFNVLKYWFPAWVALLCTIIFVAFPFDSSIYTLGFFGVNISLLTSVWGLFFLHRFYFDRQSLDLVIFLILLFTCTFTYPGPILIIPSLLFLYFIINLNDLKKNYRIYIILVFFYLVMGLMLLLLHLNFGSRAVKVMDLDLIAVLNGYGNMLKTFFWEVPQNVLMIDSNHLLLASAFGVISGLVVVHLYKSSNDKINFSSGENNYKRIKIYLLIAAAVLMLSGYFPYSISEVRYDNQRALLFSRYGFALFIAIILVWLEIRMRESKLRYMKQVMALLIFLGLTGLFTEKFKVADRMSNYSKEHAYFMSGISSIISETDINDHPIFIYIDDSDILQSYHPMVLNRPEYILAYLYNIKLRNIKIVSVNNYRIKKGFVTFDQKSDSVVTNRKKNNTFLTKKIIGIRYVPGKTVEFLSSIKIKVSTKKNADSVNLVFNNPMNKNPLKTERADFFRKIAKK
jgi:hypothetical protein